jgi:hypothetical protein
MRATVSLNFDFGFGFVLGFGCWRSGPGRAVRFLSKEDARLRSRILAERRLQLYRVVFQVHCSFVADSPSKDSAYTPSRTQRHWCDEL